MSDLLQNLKNIDIELYDRQIRTFGLEAITKISTSSVMIIGLQGGLGTEVGKNLALGGENCFNTSKAHCLIPLSTP